MCKKVFLFLFLLILSHQNYGQLQDWAAGFRVGEPGGFMARKYSENGINAELIDLRSIKPLDEQAIIKSIEKTGKVIVVDSGHEFSGFASELVKLISTKSFEFLQKSPVVVAARDIPEPTSYGVIGNFKFGSYEIAENAFKLLDRKIPIDCRELLTPIYADVPDQNFKGPF